MAMNTSSAYPSPQSSAPFPGQPPIYNYPQLTTIKTEVDVNQSMAPNVDSMLLTVEAAHNHTSQYAYERREQLKNAPANPEIFQKYQSMSRFDWWVELAYKLTDSIQSIIEFAKLVPGFLRFSQEDQIRLLKGGSFELALVRASQLYSQEHDTMIIDDSAVPASLFQSASDDADEHHLISGCFQAIRDVSSLYLNDAQIALYAALTLMSPDERVQIDHPQLISETRDCLYQCLFQTLRTTHQDQSNETVQRLMNHIKRFHVLASHHIESLLRLQTNLNNNQNLARPLPALYLELFSSTVQPS